MKKLIEKYKGKVNGPDLTLAGIVLGSAIAIGGLVNSLHNTLQRDLAYEQALNTALIKYGDTNHDNTIDKGEEKEFNKKFLREMNVMYRKNSAHPQKPRYSSGEHIGELVTMETLTKWFTDYKPAPNTKVTIPYKIK